MGSTSQQNYAQLEKEVGAFVKALKDNPRKALSDPRIGVDIKKLAAEVLEEEIANSQKTPEQIEREKEKEEFRKLKEEREQEKEVMRQEKLKIIQEQEFSRYDVAMDKAFTEANVTKSPYLVKRMADYMILGLESGKKLEPADALSLVQEEMDSDLKEMFEKMPAEKLKEFLGKDTLEKIRKHNISMSKKAPAAAKVQTTDIGTKPVAKTNAKPVSMKDFFGI
jgi:hypothetical protein